MKSLTRFGQAGFWRALGETLLLAAALLTVLIWVGPQLPPIVLSQGVFFWSAACAGYFGLRLNFPAGSFRSRLLAEVAYSTLLSLLLGFGMPLWVAMCQAETVMFGSTSGNWIRLLPYSAGVMFLALRAIKGVWEAWKALRKRRLVWEITHALLTLVLLVVSIFLVFFVAGAWIRANQAFPVEGPFPVSIVTRLIRTLLPALSISAVLALMVLTVVLPPAAVVSYWIARRVSSRLESLSLGARRLTQGEYSQRISVSGSDEIAELQNDFNRMADRLEASLLELERERDKVSALLENQRSLTATISHELRTPIATIQGYLEPLLARWSSTPSDTARRDLEVVTREVHQLARLIDDLFALSQAEVGKLSLTLAPTDLRGLIREAVDTLKPLAWQRERVEVLAELPDSLPRVQVDGGRFSQVLLNLLRNALRYTAPGGLVIVQASVEGADVKVEVRDTGIGIALQDLPLIWDRFYRTPALEEGGGSGAGLGLAVVKELTEAMGGQVSVESTPGQGSQFSLRFPQIPENSVALRQF